MTRPEAFEEPWQARAFAIAVGLSEAGRFTWPEWTARFSSELATGRPYFEAWLATAEQLAGERCAISSAALIERKEAWAQAHRRAPHGTPVSL